MEKGLGGVEEHARCLVRELRRLGVDAEFSTDPRDLEKEDWDVVQTHGGEFASAHRGAISVHTLHGTTLGRMAACGEWFWPRGYLAEAREIEGVLRSDVTLAVHPDLSLLKLARLVGKTTAVCGNGWDSAEAADALSKEIRLPAELVARVDANRALWLYIGRGEDFVKGVDRLLPVLKSRPSLQLAAAPGSGFENASSVLQTGRIDSSQVRLLLERATGLLVASRYEGNSLVVLEALALGLPVISTRVGGVTAFPEGVQGLFVLESAEPSDFIRAIEAVEALDRSEAARRVRGERNRSLLPRWSDVAKSALQAVNAVRERRAKGGK